MKDSLGSLVEFQAPAKILKSYPLGPRDLEDGLLELGKAA